jgi:hypothetical protein
MSEILKFCNDDKEKLEAVYNKNGELTTNAEEAYTLEVMASVHFKESYTVHPQLSHPTPRPGPNQSPMILSTRFISLIG